MSSHAANDIPAPWLGPRPIKGRRTVISGEGGSFSLDRVWKLSSWTENPPQHHRPLGSPSPGPVPGGLDAGRHLGPTPSAMRCRHSAARAPQMPVCCNASGYSGNRTFLGDPQPPSSIRETPEPHQALGGIVRPGDVEGTPPEEFRSTISESSIRPERGIKSETGQATSGKQKPPTGISQPGAGLNYAT